MGSGSADFTLNVGVDVNASLDLFRQGIGRVISDFNKENHEVKVGFDLKSAQEYKKLIDGIDASTKKINNRQSPTSNITDLTKAKDLLKEYYKLQSVMEKNKGKFSLAGDKKTVETEDKYLKNVATRITEVSEQYKQLLRMIPNAREVLPQFKSDDFLGLDLKPNDIKALERLIELQERELELNNSLRNSKEREKKDKQTVNGAISAYKKYQAANQEAQKLLSTGAVGINEHGFLSLGQNSGKEILDQVKHIELAIQNWNKYEEALKSVSQAEQERFRINKKQIDADLLAKNGKKTQNDIAKDQARAEKQRIQDEKKQFEEAVALHKELIRLQDEAVGYQKNGGISQDRNGKWFGSTGEYEQFATKLNEISEEYNKIKASVESVSEAEKERFKNAREANNKELAFLKEQKNRQINPDKVVSGAIERNKKYADSLKNWTASKGLFSTRADKENYHTLEAAHGKIVSLVKEFGSGQIGLAKFVDELNIAFSKADESSKAIKAAGKDVTSFGTDVANAGKKLLSLVSIYQVVSGVIRTVKQMASAAVEIESSMAQLEIVTGATGVQMENFLTKSTGLAKELGKSITDVLGSVETFSRLGYNLEDSSSLAKYANILSNVANVDVSTATTGLTSIIKGYNMDVENSEHVADVLVDVGQKYAISAEELMAAFQRGGAALAASGTDFEKSAALFAATNASLQNAESVGKHICPAA